MVEPPAVLLTLFYVSCLIVEKDCCRVKEFLPPIPNKALEGHVTKTLLLTQEGMCKVYCYQDDTCQSVNLSPRLADGKWICELSSSDDQQHSQGLVEKKGYHYYATVNPCSGYPCVMNATCQPTFLEDESFHCVCPVGFTGKKCDQKMKGHSPFTPAKSCAEVLSNAGDSANGAYYIATEGGGVAHTYCHMEEIPGCGGGGWTLVMKIDGKQTTFSYSSDLWRNKQDYSPESAQLGLDDTETKSPTYWSTPVTKVCLGMRVGETTNWLAIHQSADSLHSLLADGNYQQTNIGRNAWKSLLADSSLQYNCDREGFNANGGATAAVTRIGIVSNNEAHCKSCDSRIGFGSAGERGGQNDHNSCGNEAANANSDKGEKHIQASCYILVQ